MKKEQEKNRKESVILFAGNKWMHDKTKMKV